MIFPEPKLIRRPHVSTRDRQAELDPECNPLVAISGLSRALEYGAQAKREVVVKANGRKAEAVIDVYGQRVEDKEM
jgi:hypothetical protein